MTPFPQPCTSRWLQRHDVLLPGLKKLYGELARKAEGFKDIIKIGRTHTQDATPLTLGQELGGYAYQVEQGISVPKARCRTSMPWHRVVQPLVLVSIRNLDMLKMWLQKWQDHRSAIHYAPNKFEVLAAHDALVEMSGALKTVAATYSRLPMTFDFLVRVHVVVWAS